MVALLDLDETEAARGRRLFVYSSACAQSPHRPGSIHCPRAVASLYPSIAAAVNCASVPCAGDLLPSNNPLLAVSPDGSDSDRSESPEATLPAKLTQEERMAQERRARRLARYQQVIELHQQRVSLREIAQQLGDGRKTVRLYVNHGAFPGSAQRRRMPSILDRFQPYLIDRWRAGCHNGLQLYREITGRGYTGSRPSVSCWVAERRRHEPEQHAGCSAASASPVPKTRPPVVRRLSPPPGCLVVRHLVGPDHLRQLDRLSPPPRLSGC